MNISNIKNRADELLLTCKPQFIRIMTIMMLVGLIPSLFAESQNSLISLIYMVLTILFLSFRHGYVVSSLKIVRNDSQSLNDDDAFVGFSRFKELFSTYLVMGLIMFAIAFVIVFILMFIFMILFGGIIANAFSTLPMVYYSFISSGDVSYLIALLTQTPSLILLILLLTLIIIIVVAVLSVVFFAVPYLLEQYHMTNLNAVKESIQFMKNHIWDMIKLELSFLGWMILVAIVQGVVGELLSFIPVLGTLIAAIAAGFVGIYTYLPKYYVSQAIFFEEIAYYRYDQPYQSQMNNQGDHYNAE